jgi:hypothetical protein
LWRSVVGEGFHRPLSPHRIYYLISFLRRVLRETVFSRAFHCR